MISEEWREGEGLDQKECTRPWRIVMAPLRSDSLKTFPIERKHRNRVLA